MLYNSSPFIAICYYIFVFLYSLSILNFSVLGSTGILVVVFTV